MTSQNVSQQNMTPGDATPKNLIRAWIAVAISGLVAIGLVGVLWAVLAPVQHEIAYPPSASAPEGQALSLPQENYYRFGSIALFTLLALVVGIVIGVAVWQLRFARGVVTPLVAAGSLAVGSAAALLLGRLIRGGTFDPDAVTKALTQPTEVVRPPEITWWSVVVAPAAALAVYAIATAWHGDPDLGVPQPAAPTDPITAPILLSRP